MYSVPMEREDNEASNGWPLGLQIMNTRLRVPETLSASPAEPNAFYVPSPTFSSFSSSNLDTESTASFFQDHSVPLGRLIGIRPGDGSLYFPSRIRLNERELASVRAASSEAERRRGSRANMSHGICIPLLLSTIEKMSRNKNKSRG